MYLALFDCKGNRITTYVEGIHKNIPKGAIRISEEDQNLYATNSYILNVQTGKPIKKTPNIPTTEERLSTIRSKRDQLLIQSDKYMLVDYPISKTSQVQWKVYRQELRDFPIKCNPLSPVWPITPPVE
ncbi:tail fiber assembly protein [Anaerospora sp.]|uniref:tail fiber assembly protein n=1 Tax=Anaerospora sp. TaxID=1960278 RepID=UPI00289732C5|nr:tail fiber assembly protein [Anaerospora sp.]